MGHTACTEPQCLYKGALYLYLYVFVYLCIMEMRMMIMMMMMMTVTSIFCFNSRKHVFMFFYQFKTYNELHTFYVTFKIIGEFSSF